ncbi:MAG TPA: ECF-type sigma factor [Isosphaeraceae bacterium]|jgi:DNA-directed RNA polymerase specialized sigma24 family protein|nr:ECF-type sigma factor [Isosphaeraceae bacterium]
MAEIDSVTCLLDGLKAGDGDDIRRLWDRYFERLVHLAGARLPRNTRRVADEEDVALSAFRSFCERVGRGQFPRLADRNDLWRVLATITTRKAADALRHQWRQKRGGGRTLGESALGDVDDATAMDRLVGREPTPEEVVRFADDCDRLLARLDDPSLRSIALLRLEGHTSDEIAAALNRSTRTVDRKLALIRAIWEKDSPV